METISILLLAKGAVFLLEASMKASVAPLRRCQVNGKRVMILPPLTKCSSTLGRLPLVTLARVALWGRFFEQVLKPLGFIPQPGRILRCAVEER